MVPNIARKNDRAFFQCQIKPPKSFQSRSFPNSKNLSPLIPSPNEVPYQLAQIHDNKAAQIGMSHVICLPLAIAAVLLRLVSWRLCRASRLQADDVIVLAALVSSITPAEMAIFVLFYSSFANNCTLVNPRSRTARFGVTKYVYSCQRSFQLSRALTCSQVSTTAAPNMQFSCNIGRRSGRGIT